MNVLIVDDDPHFSELLRAVLAGEGFVPIVAHDLDGARRQLELGPPPVLLLNTVVDGEPTLDLLQELRRQRRGAETLVVALAPAPAVGWGRELGVARVFTRPFSILDLVGALRDPASLVPPPKAEPAPRASAPAPPVGGERPRLDASNFSHLVRLWARRASGILSVDSPEGQAWVTFAAGGPLDEEGMEAILRGARAGDVDFQPCDVDGSGQHAELGERLWRLAWAAVGEVEPGADFAPGRTRQTEAVDDLPVPASVRSVLRGMTHGVPISASIETLHLPADELRRGFRALALMGLVHLSDVSGPARRAAAPEPEELPTRVTRDPLAIRRLRRELQLLKDSDPWVVLGIPRNSPPEIVARSGARMSQRYGELARDGNPLVRELATSLLERIEWAIAEVSAHSSRRPDSPPTTEEDAFQHGQRAMSLGDWAQADRWFSFAHERNLDSARFLAHLGWVRFHNPDQPVQERVEEGVDYLLLAEQIDPDYADGQYFLAMALHRRGDDEGALRRVRRALKNQPDHVAAAALARKLRRPAAPTVE